MRSTARCVLPVLVGPNMAVRAERTGGKCLGGRQFCGEFLQGNSCVSQLITRGRKAIGHEQTALHIILGGIDTVERDDFARF